MTKIVTFPYIWHVNMRLVSLVGLLEFQNCNNSYRQITDHLAKKVGLCLIFLQSTKLQQIEQIEPMK